MASVIKCGLEECHYLAIIKFTKDVFGIFIISDTYLHTNKKIALEQK